MPDVRLKDKRRITKALTLIYCNDLRPFSIVNGVRFRDVASKLVDIGVKAGKAVDISELLQSQMQSSERLC